MLKTQKFAALALLSALTISPALAADKSAALVNGVSIPQSRVDLRVKIITAQGQPDTPQLRAAVREELINLELMSQAAEKSGLTKNNETKQQIELAKLSILAGAYMRSFTEKNPVGDSDLKQEYNRLKEMMGNKEYKARHILVDSEDEAKSIVSQLNGGTDFAELAKHSKDEGSKERGGELGWAVPNNFVPPFAEAMKKLNKGEYTKTPVKSQFGWHVILMDDMRDVKAPSFDEVKPQMQQRLHQKAIEEELDRLRAGAKIE